MPRRKTGPRIIGVYPKGRRHRVVYVCEDGKREEATFESKAQANRYAARLEKELSAPLSLDEILAEYKMFLLAKGNRRKPCKPHSAEKSTMRIRYLLDDVHVPALTIDGLQECYRRRIDSVRPDTHRRELGETKTFLRWCSKRGWLMNMRVDELLLVEPEGAMSRGSDSKPQLRIDEARLWSKSAIEMIVDHGEGPLGALLCLVLGLRAGEVRRLHTRDVDDDGHVLWVDGTKSESARRRLDVPEFLRPLLLNQIRQAKGPSLWKYKGNNWVYKWTQRICERAGIPIVCAQSMRGLHASLSREAGVTGHHVAKQLGHSSEQMHLLAYADAGAVKRGDQRRVFKVIQGGES